jgi:peptide/nickel transport system ATP-binding protein/oligopeptide transport system ATP-binding protein
MEIVRVENLHKRFNLKSKILKVNKGVIHAVNGVDFSIDKGKTLGLVGESGSGKSTTGRLLLRLLEPTEGKVYLEGTDISTINNREFRKIRKDIQMVFQNPYAALDYKMTIDDILTQPLHLHKIVSPLKYSKEVERLLHMVGLSNKDRKKFPHEFSGGQRQRIGIARALSTKPKFVVCDEPVSALDVSVQSQIINLLKTLQRELDLSYLFIAHGLNVIRHMSDDVAVIYLGKIVEKGCSEMIFKNPKHPYTKALMSASPVPDPDIDHNRIPLKKEIPSGLNLPIGCVFNSRCPVKIDICEKITPELIGDKHDQVACHLVKGENSNVSSY